MDEEQLIKLMNENGFTKKEIDKLLLAAEKYPATLEWVVREFARHLKTVVLTLLIVSAICCVSIISFDGYFIEKILMAIVYVFLIFIYKKYALIYVIKCHRFLKVLKHKYEEAEGNESV